MWEKQKQSFSLIVIFWGYKFISSTEHNIYVCTVSVFWYYFLFVETSVKFWRLVSCMWVNFQNNVSVTKGIAKATISIDSVRIECDIFIFDCLLLIQSCVYLCVGYAILYAPSIHLSIDSM